MKKQGVLFGASITVTKENLNTITGVSFADELHQKGCKVVFLVEYVPVSQETKELAPDYDDREHLSRELLSLRKRYQDMIFISFPGDEKSSGGCLAAGRGFFHINPSGGAEPCPFSPYSDRNLRYTTIRAALKSPFFLRLSDSQLLMQDHVGGCVLFEQEAYVRKLADSETQPLSSDLPA